MAHIINIAILSHVMPCSLVHMQPCFRVKYCPIEEWKETADYSKTLVTRTKSCIVTSHTIITRATARSNHTIRIGTLNIKLLEVFCGII
jgi:hypothetical protein